MFFSLILLLAEDYNKLSDEFRKIAYESVREMEIFMSKKGTSYELTKKLSGKIKALMTSCIDNRGKCKVKEELEKLPDILSLRDIIELYIRFGGRGGKEIEKKINRSLSRMIVRTFDVSGDFIVYLLSSDFCQNITAVKNLIDFYKNLSNSLDFEARIIVTIGPIKIPAIKVSLRKTASFIREETEKRFSYIHKLIKVCE